MTVFLHVCYCFHSKLILILKIQVFSIFFSFLAHWKVNYSIPYLLFFLLINFIYLYIFFPD